MQRYKEFTNYQNFFHSEKMHIYIAHCISIIKLKNIFYLHPIQQQIIHPFAASI